MVYSFEFFFFFIKYILFILFLLINLILLKFWGFIFIFWILIELELYVLWNVNGDWFGGGSVLRLFFFGIDVVNFIVLLGGVWVLVNFMFVEFLFLVSGFLLSLVVCGFFLLLLFLENKFCVFGVLVIFFNFFVSFFLVFVDIFFMGLLLGLLILSIGVLGGFGGMDLLL